MMFIFITEIEGTDIEGPRIKADSFEEAQDIADAYDTSAGRVIVIGKLKHNFCFGLN